MPPVNCISRKFILFLQHFTPVSYTHLPAALEVLVYNQCSVENVTRFAENSGYKVAVAPEGQDFRLSLSK